WEDFPIPARPEKAPVAYRLRVADASEADALIGPIMELEARAYEPARRDDEAHLRKAFVPGGVAIVAETPDGQLIGSALATPLSQVAHIEGPDRDPLRDKDETLYSIAVTVDPSMHGQGIGRA